MSRESENKAFTKDNIIVGIVTFNPEIVRLRENLIAVSKQVSSIVIVDNGSENFAGIETLIAKVALLQDGVGNESGLRVKILRNEKNEGIAAALSKIMDYADKESYKWVLTLDQDSVIEPGLVDVYLNVVNDSKYADAGMLTCLIKDRNFKDEKYEKQDAPVIDVEYCITSAAFTSVKAYKKTTGYDKKFFIDAVDFDICYLLSEAGFKIYRVNHIGLYHEVGHGENRRFLWKTIVVYHQKPFRIYYLARNIVWLHKKHRRLYGFLKLTKKELALFTRILLYEDNRKEKMGSFWRGIGDGRTY